MFWVTQHFNYYFTNIKQIQVKSKMSLFYFLKNDDLYWIYNWIGNKRGRDIFYIEI